MNRTRASRVQIPDLVEAEEALTGVRPGHAVDDALCVRVRA